MRGSVTDVWPTVQSRQRRSRRRGYPFSFVGRLLFGYLLSLLTHHWRIDASKTHLLIRSLAAFCWANCWSSVAVVGTSLENWYLQTHLPVGRFMFVVLLSFRNTPAPDWTIARRVQELEQIGWTHRLQVEKQNTRLSHEGVHRVRGMEVHRELWSVPYE